MPIFEIYLLPRQWEANILKVSLTLLAALLVAPPSAQAQREGVDPYEGDLQAFGVRWPSQRRDRVRPTAQIDLSLCWYWNEYAGEWELQCQETIWTLEKSTAL